MESLKKKNSVLIVGAGMAGCDAAYFLAQKGIDVVLVESKRLKPNPAQKITDFAELVCTNSLKSMDQHSSHGLLKHEMDQLGSLILTCARQTAVPAGDALAVDRDLFSKLVTECLQNHPRIKILEQEVGDPLKLADEYSCTQIIISSGPLTNKPLENWLISELSPGDFYFYDAIAPVVDADSLDYEKLYFKDRHKEISHSADYLNIPLTKEQYYEFVRELKEAQKVPPQDFEEYKFFESCLPVDLMAERGDETLRFSCMKPIGLEQDNGYRPYAVVQLRRENLLGSAYNLVGFQTRLTYKEQVRVFKTLPGFENAQFIHLGSVHRNSFIHSKKLLNPDFSSKQYPHLSFAGQITGVEGYTESAATGLYVAWQVWRKCQGLSPMAFPVETGIGALVNYVMTCETPVPSNLNFGLIPSIETPRMKRGDRKKLKKELAVKRAHEALAMFFESQNQAEEIHC